MNAARRGHKRRDWPRGLREPRPGYYTWDHPDGRCIVIGRVSLAVAKAEAIAGNLFISEHRPTLVERLTGEANTMATLIGRMPAQKTPNSTKSVRSLDKIIAAELGRVRCSELTVKQCADLIERIAAEGKARSAEAVRSRLVSICRRGRELGWMEFDPASVTRRPEVKVKRGRLTLEVFRAIYAAAPEVSEWLQHAMMLALVTGADRVTISSLQRSDIVGTDLIVRRSKTGAAVAIPLALRLDVLGWKLAEIVKHRTGVVSPLLLHHVNPWGNAPAGSKVHPDRISHAFTAARKLAGIEDEGAPTFHELRSLAKRLYLAQGNVDTRALLGHATEKMGDLYADPRGIEAIRVKIG